MFSDGDANAWLGWLIFLMISMFYVAYGQRFQAWIWMKEIEGALAELERISRKGRDKVIEVIREAGEGVKDLEEKVDKMLNFFLIQPVDRDPVGVLKRLEHLLDVRKNRFDKEVSELAPKADKEQAVNIGNALEAAIALNIVYRLVRHYYLLSKKTRSILYIAQLQMLLPEILRVSRAYYSALKAFADGKVIGDGIGALVAARLMRNAERIEEVVEDTVRAFVSLEGRKLIIIKAKGPGGRIGKPGQAILRTVEEMRGRIARIITIDAAIKLEGEKTGEIAEGVGAAIGGFGVEKYKIEEIATKYHIPLDAIAIKEAVEEAILPIKREIADTAMDVVERIKQIILDKTKVGDKIIIAGIGNTVGIGQPIGI